jgi:hypothetical protein
MLMLTLLKLTRAESILLGTSIPHTFSISNAIDSLLGEFNFSDYVYCENSLYLFQNPRILGKIYYKIHKE